MLYDAAEQDYEAAKILAQNALLPQCLFYLEQSYEKCTKAILAYTEIELRKRDATEVEGELRSKKLGHNNRASTHDL
jgi:HEPN domain-containing protein